ncbi:CRTAC1 family protein [Mesobacterium pallidum]|uniref:CRTAC1 family protein n=1 Tax=Mesobacterium pallidum TaxID=2872037 RepID=UPI001EE2315A|nr:CRTAC1 family protein [Mesobacterium pallidum]
MRPSFLLCLLAASPLAAEPRFTPRPLPEHIYSGGWEHFVGGGLAVFDCDGDDFPEMLAAGGTAPATLFRNRTEGPGALLAFEAEATDWTGLTGAYPLDIDGDGVLDLALLRVGPDRLMKGGPDCSFTDMDIGFDSGDHWTTAFSATWEAGQSLPTLAFGTYVDRTDPNGPFEACDDTLLYRPAGDRYGPPERLTPGFCALSMLFSDWSRSGRADLRVSNDRHYYVRGGEEQMWAMEDTPRLYTSEDGWRSYKLWGMGIASRDVTGDGYPDVYLTSMGDQKFQTFEPSTNGPTWADATFERGTTAHRPYMGGDGRPSTGWHAQFGDVDNDGRDDIFVAKGNVEQMPDAAMDDPNNLLMQQPYGGFSEAGATAGIASLARGRGAALSDLNHDGRLDLAVVNRRAPMELWENVSDTGQFVSLRVTVPAPNTQAIGAFVELETDTTRQVREITVGGGHAGGQSLPVHFGIGDAPSARARLLLPGAPPGPWQEIPANTEVTLRAK